MARFNVNEADKYGGQGGAGYFSLKNDKDVARVRFLYNDVEDMEAFAVHQVEVDGKKRYVNCLREYNDPVDKCPFCEDHQFQQVKFFIPLYNLDQDKVQVWERGKKFIGKISGLCTRFAPLVSHVFEIERNGKAGSTDTTYEIYEVDSDDTVLDDFEMPKILGGLVLDKDKDELSYYLEYGEFPEASNSSEEEVPSRREASNRPTGRRTPNNTRRGEKF